MVGKYTCTQELKISAVAAWKATLVQRNQDSTENTKKLPDNTSLHFYLYVTIGRFSMKYNMSNIKISSLGRQEPQPGGTT